MNRKVKRASAFKPRTGSTLRGTAKRARTGAVTYLRKDDSSGGTVAKDVVVVGGQGGGSSVPRGFDPFQVKVLVTTESVLGSKAEAARYFDVARSQPGRWINGTERPNPRARRLIQDLDYVWDRLTDERRPEAANIWLRSPNAYLNGVAPLSWLKARGAEEIIAAIDAEEAGSYA